MITFKLSSSTFLVLVLMFLAWTSFTFWAGATLFMRVPDLQAAPSLEEQLLQQLRPPVHEPSSLGIPGEDPQVAVVVQ